MRLKRQYKPGSVAAGSPEVTHVDVLSSSEEWRPSNKVVAVGRRQGWLSLAEGKITIKTGPDDSDLVYTVLAPPGTYCIHCGESCPDVAGETRPGKVARAHVKAQHKSKKSPNPDWPAGYAVQRFFMCEESTDG